MESPTYRARCGPAAPTETAFKHGSRTNLGVHGPVVSRQIFLNSSTVWYLEITGVPLLLFGDAEGAIQFLRPVDVASIEAIVNVFQICGACPRVSSLFRNNLLNDIQSIRPRFSRFRGESRLSPSHQPACMLSDRLFDLPAPCFRAPSISLCNITDLAASASNCFRRSRWCVPRPSTFP